MTEQCCDVEPGYTCICAALYKKDEITGECVREYRQTANASEIRLFSGR